MESSKEQQTPKNVYVQAGRPKELEDHPDQREHESEESLRFGISQGARGEALQGEKPPNIAEMRLRALQQVSPKKPAALTTPATSGVNNWLQLGPIAVPKGQTYGSAQVLVTGRITGIVVDPTNPQTIYAAAARGGIWKTLDGGTTWLPMSDNEVSLAIGALAIAPSAPQTLYAGTGEGNIYYYTQNFPLDSLNESYEGSGILKSVDGGNTWSLQGIAEFVGACFYRIVVHPTDPSTAFAATSNGLYRTVDGGTTWVELTNGLPAISTAILAATDVVIDLGTPTTAYAAFWGDGIYQTTNAADANPLWTKVTGLPSSDISRIALGISPSSPQNVYALVASGSDGFKGFYETVAGSGGSSWQQIAISGINVYGAYTLNVAVDIATPDIVYLSGVSLNKAVRNAMTNTWSVSDIGLSFHPDNHAFASDPTNHLVIYAGSDGGIYKSVDGGANWSDSINAHLCLAQFEFIDQNPTSDAVVFGGTQDNGTEQFRNSGVFYHAANGDGGCVAVDQTNPVNVIHEYWGASPERSTQAGKFGTWTSVSSGLTGSSLFYPLFALDPTNSNNIAFGTTVINLDSAQGAGSWPTNVVLPGITGRVSAVSYVNSNLIYAATSAGEVYRAVNNAGSWTATALHTAPLPPRWIWDIAALPGNTNIITIVMAGFGTAHVWRGVVAGGGTSATWSDISGTAPNRLPDIPINALVIDPAAASTMYIGTDIGVFRTQDDGTNWQLFNDGLPNTAVYDLKLHTPARLLRAATHGRGLWERKLDVASIPDVSIYVRDNIMDTGRFSPSPAGVTAAFEDPLHHVNLGDQVFWWQCADVKIDALEGVIPSYQVAVADVNYLAFESQLEHRDPQRGRLNRVYVQAHNRGIQAATNVTVKILYADATPGLPDLPADFWTAFPGDSVDTSHWKPIGVAQTIPSILPTQPAILEWDWTTPTAAADHSCLLVVMDSTSDPLPNASKVTNIATLVNTERHVGLKNLHVITPPPGPIPSLSTLQFYPRIKDDVVRFLPSLAGRWSFSIVFPKASAGQIKAEGFTTKEITADLLVLLRAKLKGEFALYEGSRQFQLASDGKQGVMQGLPVGEKGVKAVLIIARGKSSADGSLTIMQESEKRIIGGNTFILRQG